MASLNLVPTALAIFVANCLALQSASVHAKGAVGHPTNYAYYRSDNFDTALPLDVKDTCNDRCDVSGLCNQGQKCSALTQKYSCSDYYAPGKSYAGWCDLTCGFCSKDSKSDAGAVKSESKARMVSWNQTFSIWDSPSEVHVTRFDLLKATQDARLGGAKAVLRLTEGAAYFFTTAGLVTLRDSATGNSTFICSQTPAWVSKGACLEIEMARPVTGASNATLIVVSSGKAAVEFGAETGTCKAAVFRSGYDGDEGLHNNPVDYERTGTCSSVLPGPGGASDFDDLDMPIHALGKHYHSRGALYYNAAGNSAYDEGVASLLPGELRFVQAGFYYGPETMSDDAYVMSFHEPDPSARSTGKSSPPSGYNPCGFACFDDPSSYSQGVEPMRCKAPSVEVLRDH